VLLTPGLAFGPPKMRVAQGLQMACPQVSVTGSSITSRQTAHLNFSACSSLSSKSSEKDWPTTCHRSGEGSAGGAPFSAKQHKKQTTHFGKQQETHERRRGEPLGG
jgi:hypothetical protein